VLTGRAAVLALVVSALVLTLAYPAQRYLAQQAQLSELERDLAAQKASIAALEVRREKWDDPAYVKAQARQRLQYVMPGEVAYVIIDPARDAAEASAPSSVSRVRADGPWYGRLWSGVRAADRPATVPGAP
jgi:cell division protein FtsB